MKIVVIGAGQVGSTVVEALHDEHDITVVDLDEQRLSALAERYEAAVLAETARAAARSRRPVSREPAS